MSEYPIKKDYVYLKTINQHNLSAVFFDTDNNIG